MNATLSAQKDQRETQVGLGATRLVNGVSPPPQSPYWRAVAQPQLALALGMAVPAFRSAYNASTETRVMGTMRPILWRCWRANGVWYATSRGNASAIPTLFRYEPALNANERAGGGLKGVPDEGVGAPGYAAYAADVRNFTQVASHVPASSGMFWQFNSFTGNPALPGQRPIHWTSAGQYSFWKKDAHNLYVRHGNRYALFALHPQNVRYGTAGVSDGLGLDITGLLDDDGYLDPAKCGMGSVATTDVDLQKWGQLPVQPDAASPLWRTMTSTELSLQDKILGWDSAVATAQTHGQRMFKFKGSWYRTDGNGFSVLTGGSGRSGHRGLQGLAAAGGGSHIKYGATPGVSGYGVGQTNSSFVPPTATERANLLPGDSLVNATQAMLTTFSANGVPSEHTDSPVVRSFQVAFNADPLSNLHGSNGKLSVDGGYGPNTHDAAAVIAGSAVPDVNSAAAPVVSTVTPTLPTAPSSTSTTTTSSSSTSSYTKPLIIGALVVGAGVVTAAVLSHKKKGGKRKYRVVAPMRQLRA
jgi:hypothetical protein